MKQIIVWKRADNSVAITDCTHMDAQTFEIEKVTLIATAHLKPAYVGLAYAGDVSPAERPPQRHEHYFDAFVWDDVAKQVVARLPQCRVLKLGWLRRERDAELLRLDDAQKPFMVAKLAGLSPEWDAIETKKQKLRDMPTLLAPTLDGCADPDALDGVTFAQFKQSDREL